MRPDPLTDDAAPSRDALTAKLEAFATFAAIWPEVVTRCCQLAAGAYRSGFRDGISGGIASPDAGVFAAHQRTREVLFPIIDAITATAHEIADALGESH